MLPDEMPSLEDQFDEAMFEFTRGHCDEAIERLRAILAENPGYFDAQLALGGAYYAKGDYGAAIAEGHKAEKMKPHDQLVHTNLSRAYMKSGDKKTAEHHGLQARIASWRGDMAAPPAEAAELAMARPKPPPMKAPEKFPEMPWKKNKS
jgi:predicted Zn-dependent protease